VPLKVCCNMSTREQHIKLLEKEEIELRKLKKAKSYLKQEDILNKWFLSQIAKRKAKVKELRVNEAHKYIGEC